MGSTNEVIPGGITVRKTESAAVDRKTSKTSLRKIFRPKVAMRLLGVCFFGCLTGFLIFDTPYWMTGLWMALATVGLFYETVRFVEQSERKLTSFLQALNQNDFSITFYENRKGDDYDLHYAFNQLNETFKLLRSDKESQHHLLQVIVETAAAPMICFEEGDEGVYLMNDAAKKLFDIPFLQHIKPLIRVDPALPTLIRNIQDGEKEVLKLLLQGKQVFLSVTSCHIVFGQKNLKLIAFHDVSSELALKEAETWQKLLRVLTHEISNSAIPLSTLSSFIYEKVNRAGARLQDLSDEDRTDLIASLKTIEQRSRSLKEFVHNFRSINQVPEPVLRQISAKTLIDELRVLFSKDLDKENIALDIHEMSELPVIVADKELTMQVLINVIKNAIEAMANLSEDKRIHIFMEKTGRYVNLHITDTGCGIELEHMEQIFIPFYSTKKGGSGIGLSISQQIMQKQKGDITVRSIPGKGTEFVLTFSC